MIEFAGRGILLDIEGTTSSISFVFEVMFPYVRRELAGFLKSRWSEPATQDTVEKIARDAGHAGAAAWLGAAKDDAAKQALVAAEVISQMDRDLKATGLKALQGLIWDAGFRSGQMKSHLYPDVLPALKAWKSAGRDLRIYSSGSIQAQKLFFGHTESGDLLSLFSGHYDTTIGSKREAPSYAAIAKDWGLAPSEILFLSDVPSELAAAKASGLQVGLAIRPGNAAAPPGHGYPSLESFAEVKLV